MSAEPDAKTTPKKPFLFKGMEVPTGAKLEPLKILIYGDNGTGKSTFGEGSLNPIFLNLDGNLSHINASKIRFNSYTLVKEFVESLLNQDHQWNTLVVDSLDAMLGFIMDNLHSIYPTNELGYGRDHRMCANEFLNFLRTLDKLRSTKGMHIILTAHAKVAPNNNPQFPSHDRWTTTLNETASRNLMDWVDCVFFAVKEIGIKEDRYKKDRLIAYDMPEHWMYTKGNASYFAKNCYDLPDKMKLDWGEMVKLIKEYFKGEEK